MKLLKNIIWIIISFFGVIAIFSFIFTVFNKAYFNTTFIIDTDLASDFGSFFGGYIGTLFSIISVLLLLLTVIIQSIESKKNAVVNNFFKMLDYHNENVRQLKISDIKKNKTGEYEKVENRRVFVIFKLQLIELFKVVNKINDNLELNYTEKEIADIVYIAFYYGIDRDWKRLSKDKFSRYKRSDELVNELIKKTQSHRKKIGRTNQTSLSSYFRNMYNAIKLIDSDIFLTDKEKMKYIKILRAQLSNPELYVFFFNILSRFGKKWIENDYILKYEIIKNIPKNDLTGYDPNIYFPMTYEDEEYV